MGVGADIYMCDVVKKVHVRYLISWWVLVLQQIQEAEGRNVGSVASITWQEAQNVRKKYQKLYY